MTSLNIKNCTLCRNCIYLRTKSDLCHYKLTGFYNGEEMCLLRGTGWVFKCSILRFVFRGLTADLPGTKEYIQCFFGFTYKQVRINKAVRWWAVN
jgi:hypothetical protein